MVSAMQSQPTGERYTVNQAMHSCISKVIPLAHEVPVTIGLGAYLKNTICVTRGNEAFISQQIGDLNNVEAIRFYRETLTVLLKTLDVKPDCVAHDWHPDFYSSQIAHEFNCPVVPIQHHHAHLAAVAAESQLQTPALGLALDGFGLGENNESWGGELMLLESTHYKRLGCLKPLMQPGGDMAVRQNWRMAASVLFELEKRDQTPKRFAKQPQANSINEILEKRINSPLTTSCGRLFDAASALLGICEVSTDEAEAAIQLENNVTRPLVFPSGWEIHSNQLNLLPLFNKLLECNAVEGANLFHGTLGAALADWIFQNAQKMHLSQVLLAGGCFLNRVLSERLTEKLKLLGLRPILPKQCSVNDSSISLGQAWVAGNKLMRS